MWGSGSDPFGKFLAAAFGPATTGSLMASAAGSTIVNVAEVAQATIAGPRTDAVVFSGSAGNAGDQNSTGFPWQNQWAVRVGQQSPPSRRRVQRRHAGDVRRNGKLGVGDAHHIGNGDREDCAQSATICPSTCSFSSDGHSGTNVVDPTASDDWQVMKVGAGGDGMASMKARNDASGSHRPQWRIFVERDFLAAAHHVEQHADRFIAAANPVSSGRAS